MEEYNGEWLQPKEATIYIKKTQETKSWWKIEIKKNNYYINLGLTLFVDNQGVRLFFDLPNNIDTKELEGEYELVGEINKIPLRILVKKSSFDFANKLISLEEWSCLYQQRRGYFRVNIPPFKKSYLHINAAGWPNEVIEWPQTGQFYLKCVIQDISLGGVKAEFPLSYFPNISSGFLIKETELFLPDVPKLKSDFFLRRIVKTENKVLLTGSWVNLNGKDTMALERFIIDLQRSLRVVSN